MYQAVQVHSMMDSSDCRDVLKDTAGLDCMTGRKYISDSFKN